MRPPLRLREGGALWHPGYGGAGAQDRRSAASAKLYRMGHGGLCDRLFPRTAGGSPSRVLRHSRNQPMKHIRVLLVEDHFLARVALRAVLSEAAQICVVGEARDGEEGIVMYRSLRPDVLVLDLHLPRMSGFEVMTRVLAEHSKAAPVGLSNYQGPGAHYHS